MASFTKVLPALILVAACDGGAIPAASPEAPDAGDAGPDVALPDAALPDAAVGAYGFPIRVPKPLNCGGPQCIRPSVDVVCTLHYPQGLRYLYIQSNSFYGLDGFVGPDASRFETEGAWLSDGERATPATAMISLNLPGNEILLREPEHVVVYTAPKYDDDWRACEPISCLKIRSGGTIIRDGCSPERTLREFCVFVQADGEVPPLPEPTIPDDPITCP